MRVCHFFLSIVVTHSTLCEPGRYHLHQSASGVCAPCTPGRFVAVFGAMSCTRCPRGQVQPRAGQSGCHDCVGMGSLPLVGQMRCGECAPGQRATLVAGVLHCAGQEDLQVAMPAPPLPIVLRSHIALAPSPLPTPPPTPPPTTHAQLVIALRELAMRDAADEQRHKNEAAVHAAAQAARHARALAHARATLWAARNKTANSCVAGRYYSLDTDTCLNCTSGRYKSSSGAGGTYNTPANHSYCEPCQPGWWATTGASMCLPCAAGRFQSGLAACAKCPPGKFNSRRARPRCYECAPGAWTRAVGSIQCHSCPAGRFRGPEMQNCAECAPGRRASARGSTTCVHCAPGRFEMRHGSDAKHCAACAPGRFASDASGATLCKLCAPGRFAAKGGAVKCDDCGIQFYAGNYSAGATASNASRVGLQWNVPGWAATHCLRQCPPGRAALAHAVHMASTILCAKCLPGHSRARSGLSCMPCAPGRYSARDGAGQCARCPAGQYQPQPGSMRCFGCDFRLASLDGTRCVGACPAGRVARVHWQRKTGARGVMAALACDACGAGHAPVASAARQSPSDLASFAATLVAMAWGGGSGGQSQTPSPGRMEPVPAVACAACPKGKYANAHSTLCATCVAGHASNMVGATSCSQCYPGHFALVGAAACTACPAGKFAPSSAARSCLICESGKHAVRAGSDCSDCTGKSTRPLMIEIFAPNTSAPSFSTHETGCLKCQPGRFPRCRTRVRCESGSLTSSAAKRLMHCPQLPYTSGSLTRKTTEECICF